LIDAIGLPVVAALTGAGSVIRTDGAGVAVVGSRAGEAFDAAADAVGLDDLDAPRTLAVVAAGGGDAVAVAAGLGVAAADRGMRVLVVDADLARPTLADMLRVDASPGLADYLAGDATPRDVLRPLRVVISGGEERPLVCVPAGDGGDGIEGSRFEALVERLPRVYDLVVFAGPDLLLSGEAAFLAGLVDETVIAAASDAPPPAGLEDRLDELDRRALAGVVATSPRP
jgi:Mrp family chromosome partitioning ATPase